MRENPRHTKYEGRPTVGDKVSGPYPDPDRNGSGVFHVTATGSVITLVSRYDGASPFDVDEGFFRANYRRWMPGTYKGSNNSWRAQNYAARKGGK